MLDGSKKEIRCLCNQVIPKKSDLNINSSFLFFVLSREIFLNMLYPFNLSANYISNLFSRNLYSK